ELSVACRRRAFRPDPLRQGTGSARRDRRQPPAAARGTRPLRVATRRAASGRTTLACRFRALSASAPSEAHRRSAAPKRHRRRASPPEAAGLEEAHRAPALLQKDDPAALEELSGRRAWISSANLTMLHPQNHGSTSTRRETMAGRIEQRLAELKIELPK